MAIEASEPFHLSTIRTSSKSPDSTQNSTSKPSNSEVSSSSSSKASLTSLRSSLPENPHIYSFSELRSSTNNFLAKRFSPSSAAWRCCLRQKDVIVFQRKLRRIIDTDELRRRLSIVCRGHHSSVTKLLGASLSGGQIYLAYEFVTGSSLSDCLRNPRNPDFTVLSSWISRMQVATDLAHGLNYIHDNTNLVHNRVRSNSILVTEPSFHAKICHFGTSHLVGDPTEPSLEESEGFEFEGSRGYMSPEYRATGVGSQKSDLYAFGVVILELLSGSEPLRFRYERSRGEFERSSVIDRAERMMYGGQDGEREWRLRRWVDKRLKDSFPVRVVEKVALLALDCVDVDPDRRPDMRRVEGKMSKLYLESRVWLESAKVPDGISVSFTPR